MTALVIYKERELLALFALICIALYAAAATVVGLRLFHQQGPHTRSAVYIGMLALALHFFLLTNSIMVDPGQNMSLGNVISLVAWLIAITMTVSSFYLPNTILLPVVFAFAGLMVLANIIVPDSYIVHIELRPGLLLHITLALFSYGCLMIALLYALQLAYINGRLKQKRASLLHSSLPPLMAVEQLLFKLLLVGTVLLTLSLFTGFTFLNDMFDKQHIHKSVLSLIAWVIFTTLLLGHKCWGWRGKPVISATVVGTLLLTLAYFGSRFVREVILA